jgi:DNA polymerase family B, exonuclease domain
MALPSSDWVASRNLHASTFACLVCGLPACLLWFAEAYVLRTLRDFECTTRFCLAAKHRILYQSFSGSLSVAKRGCGVWQVSHPAEGDWAKMSPFRILSIDIECAGRKVPEAADPRLLTHRMISCTDLSGCARSCQLCQVVTEKCGRMEAVPAMAVLSCCRLRNGQGHFPEAEKDPVIQIASMLSVHGQAEPLVRNIMTLDTCDSIVGAEARPPHSRNPTNSILAATEASDCACANLCRWLQWQRMDRKAGGIWRPRISARLGNWS